MNDSVSRAKGLDDMNDSRSWTQGSRCHEKHRVVVHMNDSRSCAEGSKCNEKLQAMKHINDSGL